MNINNLLMVMEKLKNKGYGENEVVIWAKDIFNNDHHTIIEDVEITNASWDNKRKVIVLLP